MMDDDLADLLAADGAACAAAGVEPLPEDDLAVIANAVLNGTLPVFVTVH